jgi:hypothetical protein
MAEKSKKSGRQAPRNPSFLDILAQQLPDDSALTRGDRAQRLTEYMQEFERAGL